MNRKEAFKEETRRLILEAARKLFFEKEFSQCTIRAVAKEAGVSAASVVVHFKNKIALMEAALVEEIKSALDRAFINMPTDGRIALRMRHIWQIMFEFYNGNRDLYRELLSGTVFKIEEDTPYISNDIETFFKYLEDVIKQEKVAGRMVETVDSHTLSVSLFLQYFGVLIMFFRDPTMTPRMAAEFVQSMNQQTLTGHEISEE